METMNATIAKFGYPQTLIKEFEHWVLLLRPAQVTVGSMVLAAKSDALAFGELPPGAHSELAIVTRQVEQLLQTEANYQKINYLMLMMVDPHVHFHIFPRYEGSRSVGDITLDDKGWPGPPELSSAVPLNDGQVAEMARQFSSSPILCQ